MWTVIVRSHFIIIMFGALFLVPFQDFFLNRRLDIDCYNVAVQYLLIVCISVYMYKAELLTVTRPWSCETGRLVGSSCTPPPLSRSTAAGSGAYCAVQARCLGYDWLVAVEQDRVTQLIVVLVNLAKLSTVLLEVYYSVKKHFLIWCLTNHSLFQTLFFCYLFISIFLPIYLHVLNWLFAYFYLLTYILINMLSCFLIALLVYLHPYLFIYYLSVYLHTYLITSSLTYLTTCSLITLPMYIPTN